MGILLETVHGTLLGIGVWFAKEGFLTVSVVETESFK